MSNSLFHDVKIKSQVKCQLIIPNVICAKKKKQGTVRVKCGLHLPKNRENIFYHTIIIQGFQKVKM